MQMLKNNLKIALRHIGKHKGSTFINITGLALGMAVSILILLWVLDELSYDRFHANADEICRVTGHSQSIEGGLRLALTPPPLAETLVAEFPDIIDATRVFFYPNWLVGHKENKFIENGFVFTDPSFFKIFSFPFINGDPASALSKPDSLVITRRMAVKYFGSVNDAVGQRLTLNNRSDLTITGIIEDIPLNSHIRFDFAVRFTDLASAWNIQLDHWGDNSYYTYVQLRKGADPENVGKAIANVQKNRNKNSTQTLALQRMTDIHLYSSFLDRDAIPHGDIKYVYLFSLLAFLILLTACINFISLTTAQGASRAKEVGIKKVSGADRKTLIGQFFSETLLLTFFALVLAVVIVDHLLPLFNNLSGKQLVFDMFTNPSLLIILLLVTLLTGVLSATYPALFLSSFQPVNVLKGTLSRGSKGSLPRKVMVVVQFSISVFLIIASLVIYKQLNYIRDKKLGYDKDHVIYLRVRGDISRKYDAAKKELLKHTAILHVTRCSDLPTDPIHLWGDLNWPGKDPRTRPEMYFFSADADFIKTFNIEMAAGEDFSAARAEDRSDYIINQAAAKFMGLAEPVGQWLARGNQKGTIIGVMKDFHFNTIRKPVAPLVLRVRPYFRYIFVKVNPADIPGAIAHIKKTWNTFNPAFPMEYRFLDEEFKQLYNSEQQLGQLFTYFTLLAIFISCMGLFGLASFMAVEKTKEIGIRKVLGSSVLGIITLLSREFVFLVVVANIIAWPLAFFTMNRWLRNWAYHTDLNLFLFISAAAITLACALISVVYQSVKAAAAKPVDALRYE
jgi:ABC-type antimicrobial peptide transport system permease subunit